MTAAAAAAAAATDRYRSDPSLWEFLGLALDTATRLEVVAGSFP